MFILYCHENHIIDTQSLSVSCNSTKIFPKKIFRSKLVFILQKKLHGSLCFMSSTSQNICIKKRVRANKTKSKYPILIYALNSIWARKFSMYSYSYLILALTKIWNNSLTENSDILNLLSFWMKTKAILVDTWKMTEKNI